jgi:antirestriction protein ArdC
MEELIAELASAFLSVELGVTPTPRPDHAHYLKNWLQVLQNDDRSIFTAASKASEATAYLHNLQHQRGELDQGVTTSAPGDTVPSSMSIRSGAPFPARFFEECAP